MPRYRQAFSSSIQRLLLSSFILSKQHDDTNSLAQSTSLASVDSCSFTSPTIILIIGESFNKYQTKLYNNQSLLTTPHLCERATKGNIIPYNDVVSPYNQTNKVLRQLFSMSNCDCSDNWCDYPLFLALFKKAGYEVTFVSNQYPKETYKSMWSKFDSSVFNNERLDSLQFSLRNLTDFGNDINITQVFQTLPRNANKCSIIVFHLLGQHSDYSRRHPEDYTPIAKEDIKLEYNDSEQARDIAWHYANATHYNDFVVDSIFKLFDNTETVGIYLSDHGEEVYDFRDFYHRSHEDPSYYNIAKYEYEVPFMFYATDKYQAAHPEIMQQIREAKDRPFMTDDLPQVMLYLAGIKQKDYDETRNVLSPNFNTKRKRLLNDKYDFDAIRAASKEQ